MYEIEITIENLPNELIIFISRFLKDRDIQNFMSTNIKHYKALQYVFKKTHLYARFLHNYFLAFHMIGRVDLLDKTVIGQQFSIKKYCNVSKLQNSIFVISRVGNIWSWRNISLCHNGTFKNITCNCDSKYCNNEKYNVEINLRKSTLIIAIKLNMWDKFVGNTLGFKKAFSDIKHLFNQHPYS